MRVVASWCFRHRKVVLVGWLLMVAGVFGLSQVTGTAYSDSFSLPSTESTQALQLLQANAPGRAGDTEQIVIAAQGGARLTDPAVRAQATALFAKLAALPDVTGVVSPYEPGPGAAMNADRTIAFAGLNYSKSDRDIPDSAGSALVNTARSSSSPQLQVAVEGQVADKAASPSLSGVGFGVLAAAVVLIVVFGSLLAASLPLISTLLALVGATSAIGMFTHLVTMPTFSSQLVLLIGLGVGVDYALFIVTRFRQGLQVGKEVESAIVTAVATSGRAVLFAGAVVVIALLGMIALGVSFLAGLGIAASIGVAFTMAASITLLPAMLGFFGQRVLTRGQRRRISAGTRDPESGVWWRWSALVARRPAIPAVAAFLAVAVLTIPFFSLRLGSADAGNGPADVTTRQAYDLLAKGFGPGFNGPLEVAVQTTNAADTAALTRITQAIGQDPGVVSLTPVHTLATHGSSQIQAFAVYPKTSPQDQATTDLIHRLRDQVIPSVRAGSGIGVYIGGLTATNADFAQVLTSKLPLFVALVVLLSFLLLMIVFRSLLIPMVAAAMNLLSAGAALGVMSAVYVWGWGGDLLGASRAGPIEPYLPVMVFAILFGLSMDYQVFLVSRMHEEWHRTGDNKTAITRGLGLTGRTITAAALIMILVFGSFILGGDRVIKEFGVGLAVAVFIDAFLVRVAIVPALMFLLGNSNWWLPTRLAAILPKVTLEDDDTDTDAGPVEAPHPQPAAGRAT